MTPAAAAAPSAPKPTTHHNQVAFLKKVARLNFHLHINRITQE